VWVNGASLGFTNWNTNEPNNSGDEDCVELRVSNSGRWNDKRCSEPRHSVCEVIAPSPSPPPYPPPSTPEPPSPPPQPPLPPVGPCALDGLHEFTGASDSFLTATSRTGASRSTD
jgi:hypothetical protein